MPTYLITGANRGLGLEFVRQLAADSSNTIIATTRPNADTADLKSISSPTTHILDCDLTDQSSITALARAIPKTLPNSKLDVVLANAGANSVPEQTVLTLQPADLHREIDINVLGPMLLTSTLLSYDLLSPTVRIVNMTSGLGSMGKSLTIEPRKCATYSISKAGLNMVTVQQSGTLREKLGQGVVVVCMDPGWVKTRMGGEGAILEPEQSIGGMLKVVKGLGKGDNGKFFQYDGEVCPW